MSRRSDDNKDVLSKIHEQIVKDQNNDSTQTGSFPVVRRKPRRISLNAKAARARLYSSVLVTVLCALLGFSYAIQLNNTTSTYETMSEDELTKLISETSTQVQKLEKRKSELSSQLDSLKDTADKNEKSGGNRQTECRIEWNSFRTSAGIWRRRGHQYFQRIKARY